MNAPIDIRRAAAAEAFRAQGGAASPRRGVEIFRPALRHRRGADRGRRVRRNGSWRRSPAGPRCSTWADSNAPDWAKTFIGSSPGGLLGTASLAFARTGFALRVAKAAELRVAFPTSGQARVLIVIEDGATLSYTEAASGDGFQNIGVDVVVGAARASHPCPRRA